MTLIKYGDVDKSLSEDAKHLARFFFDNIFASIRYVHHQGYGPAAQELLNTGFIEQHDGLYIMSSRTKTELLRKEK
jgi:hypothetical protein